MKIIKETTKNTDYLKTFATENEALDFCEKKNKANRRAKNFQDIYAVVDGPEDDYAVVDLKTAIELGSGYQVIG